MRKLEDSGKVDLSTWELQAIEDLFGEQLRKAFLSAVSEALNLAIEDGPYVRFAPERDEKDPTKLVLSIPLGDGYSEDVMWEFSLAEIADRLVARAVEYNCEHEIDEAKKVGAALRIVADGIDKKLREREK